MSDSESWTVYFISSANYFDQPLELSTRHLPAVTDAEAFSIANAIVTALGGSLGSDVLVNKLEMTQVDYITDYANGTFS